jgi:ELWxxDGT repeat protein
VADIYPGHGGSDIQNLTALGSKVFFSATSPNYGNELWSSDGTAAGTRMVADINPGAASSMPEYLTVDGTSLFFVASDPTHPNRLWKWS